MDAGEKKPDSLPKKPMWREKLLSALFNMFHEVSTENSVWFVFLRILPIPLAALWDMLKSDTDR
jgi:hypothetical protein